MSINLLSIGSELLTGNTINTNAATIGKHCLASGWQVDHVLTIADRKEVICDTFRSLEGIVIVTGGLGPTLDDVTLASAMDVFGEDYTPIPNPLGTAEGAIFENRIFLLPGVPIQMERMLIDTVIPTLKKSLKREVYFWSCYLSFKREQEVDPFLRKLEAQFPSLEVGICPSYGRLTLSLLGNQPLDSALDVVEKELGSHIYHEASMAHRVHHLLTEKKKTLALAESISGGHIAAALTSIEGASEFLLGSIVSYSNAMKEEVLRVDTLEKHGAVSPETARAMWQGLFEITQADYALAVTGIAGPTGGTEEKPVGTIWVCVGKRGGEPTIQNLDMPWKSRTAIIAGTVERSLGLLEELL